MNILGIMSSPVIVTRTGTTLKHTRDLFKRKEVNAIPVLNDEGIIAGIISASDAAKAHSDAILVDDLMTKKVHIVLKNTRVKDAAATMIKHHVHHLVVMDNGQILGMVSALDLLGAFIAD